MSHRSSLFLVVAVLCVPFGMAGENPLTATYIHGITPRIARQAVPPEQRAELPALLADPAFPRRDNLVAFLAHLGGPEATTALGALLVEPPADLGRPEEQRALLLAPQALGRIAARGDGEALEILLRMTAETPDETLFAAARRSTDRQAMRDLLVEAALRGLGWSGLDEAEDRLADVALGRIVPRGVRRDPAPAAATARELLRAVRSSGSLPAPAAAPRPDLSAGEDLYAEIEPPGGGAGEGPTTDEFDPAGRVHENAITYANHVAVPNPMTDGRLDSILDEASLRAGRSDYAGDVGCCITVARSGTAKTFGSSGDGLDVIDNSSELNQVLNNGVARAKVVRAINYCGGPGFNIIGCAWTPGNGMAVVRTSGFGTEAVLWIHEYGHNTGLPHAPDSRQIMYGTDTGSNRGLVQNECNTYHNPSFLAGAQVTDIGACTDADGDEVQDLVDNCPAAPNNGQTDSDGDDVGDACDNCPSTANADQANFDGDAQGDVCDPDDDNDGVNDGSDCAPFNASVWSAAGEASGLLWAPGSTTTLTWSPGDQAEVSNVYRGNFAATFDPAWTCRAADVAGSSFEETDTPAAGAGFHFVVTGENVCGESTAGQDSDGVDRSVDPCP